MLKLNEIQPQTEAYFAWLANLPVGAEVVKCNGEHYWHKYRSIQVVIENKDGTIILSDGSRYNAKTGRESYTKPSYRDHGVHLLPVTDEIRYDFQKQEVRERFVQAVENTKWTISEMETLIDKANGMLKRRKSHVPAVGEKD